MGKYLRPRRGNENLAVRENIKLLEGEIFLEYPEGRGIGKSPGRIIIGNNNDTYNQKVNSTTETNVFQPFITDPSIYVPLYDDSAPQPDYKYDDTDRGGSIINNIIEGVRKLPEIIGAIKKVLSEHTDNLRYDDYRIKELQENLIQTKADLTDYINNKVNTATSTLNTKINSATSTLDNKINNATSTLDTNMGKIAIMNIDFWANRGDGYWVDQQGRVQGQSHDLGGGLILVTARNKDNITYQVTTTVNDASNNISGLTGTSYYSWKNQIGTAAYQDTNYFESKDDAEAAHARIYGNISENVSTLQSQISAVSNSAQRLIRDELLNHQNGTSYVHNIATASKDGFMSASDKAKLDRYPSVPT